MSIASGFPVSLMYSMGIVRKLNQASRQQMAVKEHLAFILFLLKKRWAIVLLLMV
jgi:hypothetical protein